MQGTGEPKQVRSILPHFPTHISTNSPSLSRIHSACSFPKHEVLAGLGNSEIETTPSCERPSRSAARSQRYVRPIRQLVISVRSSTWHRLNSWIQLRFEQPHHHFPTVSNYELTRQRVCSKAPSPAISFLHQCTFNSIFRLLRSFFFATILHEQTFTSQLYEPKSCAIIFSNEWVESTKKSTDAEECGNQNSAVIVHLFFCSTSAPRLLMLVSIWNYLTVIVFCCSLTFPLQRVTFVLLIVYDLLNYYTLRARRAQQCFVLSYLRVWCDYIHDAHYVYVIFFIYYAWNEYAATEFKRAAICQS